jgi:3-oxoacyl-[acyl-carrier protein] reductase
MIHVLETWRLKDEYVAQIPQLMQEMDNLVGPPAHAHPAFCGHATFLRDEDRDPSTVWVLYPWRSRGEADDLIDSEVDLIAPFTAKYCAAPREVAYLTEVPHTHDMADHDHRHAHA